MKPTEVDLHIHTQYCPCAKKEMTVEAVVEKASERGLKAIGFVPHSYPIAEHGPEKLSTYEKVREEVERISEPGLSVFVGAEVECLDVSGKLLAGEEIARRVEYILVAPGHYHIGLVNDPPKEKRAFLDYHHRTILNLLEHPLVSAIAHPYHALLHILPDFREVAEGYFREEARKAKENGKAMEMNRNLLSPRAHSPDSLRVYERFVEILADEGVMLLLGSDAHILKDVGKVPNHLFERFHIPESQIWLPKR
jgi:histidinol phosphatase-like PHP family hydrolase